MTAPWPEPAPAEALTVRPGDTLVIRLPAGATMQEVDNWKQATADLQECMPGVEIVVLGGCEQIAVYRSENRSDRLEKIQHERGLRNRTSL